MRSWSIYNFLVILFYIYLVNCVELEETRSKNNDDDNALVMEATSDQEFESVKTVTDFEDYTLFIPTEEWQEVKQNHKLPAGLHIRINMQTGAKEAKLMGDSGRDFPISNIANQETDPDSQESEPVKSNSVGNDKLLREHVISALKNMKSDDSINQEPNAEKVPNTKKKSKFRSYDTLKAEFDDLHINVESDPEILRRLITEYGQTDDNVKLSIIEDLDYLTHQIDNAVDFVSMDGIKKIILPGLNSSNEDIRKSVMRLIGSASQNNPKVQIAAFEEGLLSHLLRVVAREKDTGVSSKAVFALSCLVRGFPYGQQRLIESGGLYTLREVFLRQDWQSLTLQLKVISLIQDLLEERANAEGERAKQFNKNDLLTSLVDGEWCSAVSSLLAGVSFDKKGKREDLKAALGKSIPLRPDHDMVDKIVHTMSLLAPSCQQYFFPALPLLRSLKETYSDLAYKEKHQGEDGYEYFQELASQIQSLFTTISRKGEL